MKLRTRMVITTCFVAALAGTAAVAYKLILTDEAKTGVKRAAQAVQSAYREVSDTIAKAQGITVEDDSELPNVQATRAQWKSMGY